MLLWIRISTELIRDKLEAMIPIKEEVIILSFLEKKFKVSADIALKIKSKKENFNNKTSFTLNSDVYLQDLFLNNTKKSKQ